MIKRLLSLGLAILMACASLVSCSEGNIKLLSFAEAQSIEDMAKYDEKTVTIIGYMSTLSPASGKFMYLMNMPYQSCPFCIPNTTQLSNTIAIYSKEGKKFEFTDKIIQVTGKLDFCDNGTYEDELGYEYSYRIINASYEVLNTDNMSEEFKQWQEISASGIISEIYDMYNYLSFVCYWPTYSVAFENGSDYIHPGDVKKYFLEPANAQYNYGYREGYFDALISKAEAYNNSKVDALVENLKQAKQLASNALLELESENYSYVPEYSGAFGDGRYQYKLLNTEIENKYISLYREFDTWLSSWEI